MSELEVLRGIEFKLEQILQLTKLANAEKLETLRKEITSNPEMTKILELTQQPIPYKNLVAQVMTAAGAGERTVQSRISKLRADGILTTSRQGSEVFYVNSGLLE